MARAASGRNGAVALWSKYIRALPVISRRSSAALFFHSTRHCQKPKAAPPGKLIT
jgi:hypothetical protein